MIEERLIHSHTDVVDCFSPSIQLKVSTSARPGRPSLIIGFDEVMFLRSINFSWLNIAQMYGVSRTTIYTKCKEAGILNLEKNNLLLMRTCYQLLEKSRRHFQMQESECCQECCMQETYTSEEIL